MILGWWDLQIEMGSKTIFVFNSLQSNTCLNVNKGGIFKVLTNGPGL